MTLPPQVTAPVAGATEDAAWKVVLPLLTVDVDGFPRVCQLSGAEVDIDDTTVHCVVRGTTRTSTVPSSTASPRAERRPTARRDG